MTGTELSFTNTNTDAYSVNLAMGMFGGLFEDAPCVDYWGTMPDEQLLYDIPSSLVVMDGADGLYKHFGSDITIAGGQITKGSHVTMYVEGDVSITRNIAYEGIATGWANRGEIASFKLIVLGSIFIDRSVTQLDGVYVAVPKGTDGWNKANSYADPNPGTISTCASGFDSYNPTTYDLARIEVVCGPRQLTVFGGLIAQQLWLLRAYGASSDPNEVSGTAAERIFYTPEVWLSHQENTDVNLNAGYDSILALPPQL